MEQTPLAVDLGQLSHTSGTFACHYSPWKSHKHALQFPPTGINKKEFFPGLPGMGD